MALWGRIRACLAGVFGVLAFLPCTVVAQEPSRPAQIEAAWSDWLDAGGTDVATLAVLRDGDVVLEAGRGISATSAMPMASLGKLVTAACIADLVTEGRLSTETRVGEILAASGPAAEQTIGALLTHSSGIWPDATQGRPPTGATSALDDTAHRALRRDPQEGAPGTFAYNNENYAVLGLIVETVTGDPYDRACRRLVLDPLGISTATLDGMWGAHGSWGGWSMSAGDYARVVWATLGPDTAIGAAPEAWPSVDIGGARYGMGAFWRAIRGRTLFWSSGMLCWEGEGVGGYFASYDGEWIVVTLYADCLAGTDRLRALDEALFRAAVR